MKTGSILVLLLFAAAAAFAQADRAYAYNNWGVYCIESGILDEAIVAFTEFLKYIRGHCR